MKNTLRKVGMIALVITVMASCKKDEPTPVTNDGLYEDGYFVTNEGNFGTGNGSISFISDEGIVTNDVFTSVFSSNNLALDFPILKICPRAPPPAPPDIRFMMKIQTPIMSMKGSNENRILPNTFSSVLKS